MTNHPNNIQILNDKTLILLILLGMLGMLGMRYDLEIVVLLLWLPACFYGNHCNVGEIVWNEAMERMEGKTITMDCGIMWPTANQRFCKKYGCFHFDHLKL